MSKIADLFCQSPFEPLRQHMDQVMECVSHLRPMFELARAGEHGQLEDLAKTVFKAEHQADEIKDEIRQSIPRTFFLPVYRGDLLGYLALQDGVADAVEDVAFLLTVKRLTVPSGLAEELLDYVDSIVEVADRAYDVSKELTVLVEQGFNGAEVEKVMEMVAVVDKAEWEADRKQYRLSKLLFAMEDDLRATDVLLWFRVFAVLGELADHAEKAADRVRRMLAK